MNSEALHQGVQEWNQRFEKDPIASAISGVLHLDGLSEAVKQPLTMAFMQRAQELSGLSEEEFFTQISNLSEREVLAAEAAVEEFKS